MTPAPDAADRLYELPLEEFTRARDELARELRRGGDRTGADEVRKLRKPSAAAWAVNQLARRRRPGIEELIDAGGALRDAQERVLAGEDPRLLAEAGQAERAAVGRLVHEARHLIAEDGRKATAAVLERVADTLHAAASDDELRGELERGRVLQERRPAAFAGLAPSTGAPAKARRAAHGERRQTTDRSRAEAEERRQAAEASERREHAKQARAELRRLRKEARDAEQALARAERNVAKAERAAEEARREAERATRAVQDAERRLAELESSD